ncbi:MAG: VOC family protein [Chloroflexota bacterium]
MVKGIHHIGASVRNLDDMVAFYQGAVDLPYVLGFETAVNPIADRTAGLTNIRSRTALLGAATTYLELFEYESPAPPPQQIMPVYGPGITHVCFQSPDTDPAFEKFRRQGMEMVSRGDRPVRLAPQREITYAYARDVSGNMFEMEQWGTPPRPFPVWTSHVAFVSPDIQRLTNFYSTTVLQLDALPEIRRINGIPNLDVVGNADNVDLYGTWVPTPNILIEIWQYVNPKTPDKPSPSSLEILGYTHICFEVDDLAAEYKRLSQLDVPFISEPVRTPNSLIVFGRDPDGNIFELLQYLDKDNPLSLSQLDFGLA